MNGKAHRAVTVAAAPAVALAAGYATGDLLLALAAGAGCYAGIWCHPDWDVNNGAPLWRQPYAKLLHHRSRLSHWPIVGTLGRLLYLSLLLLIPAAISEIALRYLGVTRPLLYLDWPHVHIGIAATAGLVTADTLHWVGDWKGWNVFKRSSKKMVVR